MIVEFMLSTASEMTTGGLTSVTGKEWHISYIRLSVINIGVVQGFPELLKDAILEMLPLFLLRVILPLEQLEQHLSIEVRIAGLTYSFLSKTFMLD